MTNWKIETGLITTKAIHMEDREAVISARVDSLESGVVSVESKEKDKGSTVPFNQPVRLASRELELKQEKNRPKIALMY